jgi:hypothetical protein
LPTTHPTANLTPSPLSGQPNKNMTTIQCHTNASGEIYFSTTNEDGETIYSFSKDFDDIWTQDDEDAIAAGSTPSKI